MENIEEGIEQDASHLYIEQETLDMLYSAIDNLPEKYRTIFELSFEQGLSINEIADRLNLSVSGVKKQKAKMIDMLRQSIPDNNALLIIYLGIIAS